MVKDARACTCCEEDRVKFHARTFFIFLIQLKQNREKLWVGELTGPLDEARDEHGQQEHVESRDEHLFVLFTLDKVLVHIEEAHEKTDREDEQDEATDTLEPD